MSSDFLDIPAFLRRHTESSSSSMHSGSLTSFKLNDQKPLTLVEWLISHDHSEWPTCFDALDRMGVSIEVITWIRIQAEDDRWKSLTEEEVIAAFLEALPQLPAFSKMLKKGPLKGFLARIRGNHRYHPLPGDSAFTQHMAESLKDIQPDDWGKAISEVFDCMA